jgi:D-inositol-3-phosphate glycosyltransferase
VPLVWHRNDHTIFERAVIPAVRHDAQPHGIGRALRVVGSLGDFFDARSAAEIITLDETSRDMARHAFRRSAVAVPAPPAEHFFDPPPRSEARSRLGLDPETFLVLGVGIMTPHRRFEDLVAALALIDDPAVRVLIVGSDHVDPEYGRVIAERARALGLEERLTLSRSAVPEDMLRAAYAGADLFAFPNDHRQSWGLAPLEALAAGTPIVITRAAGVASVLAGRPGVDVIEPHDPGALADVIRRRRDQPDRSGAAATGRWVHVEWGGARYAERIAGVFETVSTS